MAGEAAPPEPDAAALSAMRAAVDALPRRRDQLLPALRAAGQAPGWLPRAAIEHVASHVRIPLSEVYATATTYSELRLEGPPVAGQWRVCTGIACRQAGADALLEALGERAAATDCRFLCALAPVVQSPPSGPSSRPPGPAEERHEADRQEALLGRCTPQRLRALAASDTGGASP